MELQQYFEASLHLVSDLIILVLLVKYHRVFGFLVTVLLACYAAYSLVFYVGILGLPVASSLFEVLMETHLNEDGKMVPTLLASVVGTLSGLLKVGLAVAFGLLGQKLITSASR